MLQALLDYAAREGLVIEPGFQRKNVRWALDFTHDGRFLAVLPLGIVGQRGPEGRTLRCPHLSLPEIKRGGSGCRHFLVDNAEVVAQYSEKALSPKQAEKLEAKHAYFVDLLLQAGEALGNEPLLHAARTLVEEQQVAQMRTALAEAKVKATDNVTLMLDGELLVQSDTWHAWWRTLRSSLAPEPKRTRGKIVAPIQRIDLLTGELVEPAATHPKVKHLSDVGGLAMGDALASFKQDSFRSYGLEQSANAAMSEATAALYTGALNHLLETRSHRLSHLKVAYWYRDEVPRDADPLALLQVPPLPEEGEADSAESALLKKLRSIETAEDVSLDRNRYYALSLSANSGRVVVRDWLEGPFAELVTNVRVWFEDLSIVRRDGQGLAPPPKLFAVLGALVRDLGDLTQPTIASLWRAALRNEPLAHQFLAQALERVRVDLIQDNVFSHARFGLLKAVLRRDSSWRLHMTEYLNPEHPSKAYQCGRLMAVLARLQRSALGDVGAGVVQRYYAAASATPDLVLGRLVRTAQFHLNKLDKGLAYWFEDQIAGICAQLQDAFPATLGLQEQSLFALGYYQQLAHDRAGKQQTADAHVAAPDVEAQSTSASEQELS